MEFYAIPEGGASLEEGGGSKFRVVVGFLFKSAFDFSRSPDE